MRPLAPEDTNGFPHHAPCTAPTDLDQIAALFTPVAGLSVPTVGRYTVVGMCEARSADFRVICSVHQTNVERYVRAWGSHEYAFSFFNELPEAAGKRHMTWYKIPTLYKTIRTPGVEYAFWMDSDSLFMSLTRPMAVPSPGKYLAISTHSLPSVVSPDYINAGHLSLRRGKYTDGLLRAVWEACPSPWTITRAKGKSKVALTAAEMDAAKVDHEEQSALIFVLGGSKLGCRESMGGTNTSIEECLTLRSTTEYDILPAVVMNSNVPHFKHGDLVLHLWGWQCDWSIGALLNSSWLVPFGGTAYNTTDRDIKIREVLVQAGLNPGNDTMRARMSHNCIVQDHEKAYIMTTLDAQIGAMEVARGHKVESDLVRDAVFAAGSRAEPRARAALASSRVLQPALDEAGEAMSAVRLPSR